MRARDIARAARRIARREARESRATWRGNVKSVNSDGSAQVTLPSGAEIKIYPSNLFPFNTDTSVTLLRTGRGFEVLGPSAYQGGLGSPYAPPE